MVAATTSRDLPTLEARAWPRRRRVVWLAGVAALLATLASPGVAAVGGSTATAEEPSTAVLEQWNLIAQGVTVPLRPTAHGQLRNMAMVQGAVYDAVNAIDGGHQAYVLEQTAEPGASYDAAIATAAHHVLVAIAPAAQATLDTQLADTLDDITDGAAKTAGQDIGAAAATAMLEARVGDGFVAPFQFVLGDEAGDWRPVTPTALDPDAWVANLRPFLIEDPSRFSSDGPNALSSDAYARDFNEVKRLGALDSATRTADQTRAAIFWQAAPIALWNRAFREISAARGLGLVEESRLLAMINFAAVDGAIACWTDKYQWNFWRPMAAIREASTDGNPATIADPTWRPLFDPATPTTPALGTPPFPEHPSGHGCVSGAVLHTARALLGTDKISFDVNSGRFPGQPRHFDRLSAALKEIIDARVWGGIHFRTADVQGAVLGMKVSRWIERHSLQPVG